jgi:AcrR family transcriptional regulator
MPKREELRATAVSRKLPTLRPGPEGGKRDTNRKLRTEALCRAALDMFLQRGLDAVTIDDIVGRANVAKGSFYRYFKDKAELVDVLFSPLEEILTHALSDFRDRLPGSSDARAEFHRWRGELRGARAATRALVHLFLQERRGAATVERAPVRTLADLLGSAATELAGLAHKHAITAQRSPVLGVAALAAIEQLVLESYEGRTGGDAPALVGKVLALFG